VAACGTLGAVRGCAPGGPRVVLIAMVAMLLAPPAGAEDEPVHIEYRAPEECMSGADFLHEALARTEQHHPRSDR